MNALVMIALALQDGPSVTVARDAIQPQLAADRDGGFYCVYLSGGNVMVKTSSDGGKTWGEAVVAIDAQGKAKGGMQRGPRIGVDGRKNVVVTAPVDFDEWAPDQKYPKADLWMAVSSDGGRSFGKPLRVNDVPKKAVEALHALAVGETGEAHVAWLDCRDQQRGNDIFYAKVKDGKAGKGLKIGVDVCACCAPGMAVDGKGNPIVAWREGGRSTNRNIFVSKARDGGKSWSAPARVNQGETKVPN
jgi:hypothetical protein